MDEARNEIVVYQPDGTLRLEVRLEGETVWLNRRQMAQLFGRDVKTIGKHIANSLSEELSDINSNAVPVVANFATTGTDGKTYQVEYYSLDVILSVGYRVKSSQGIRFLPRQLFKEFEPFDRWQPAKSSGSSRLKLFFPRLRET